MPNNLTKQIAQLAAKALLYEVALTPKPGLVDRANNGSHNDMNYYTFLDSIVALTPYFQEYVDLGYHHEGTLDDLFDYCRVIGIQAEQDMLAATQAVNTHKGANFSFGVILTATGYFLKNNPTLPLEPIDVETILVIVQKMTENLIKQDFAKIHLKAKLSNGERLYLEKGMTGIRGEAANGYPAVHHLLLPFLRRYRDSHEKDEVVLLRSLVLLMSEIEDGNILHRGGYEQWQLVKKEMQELHEADLNQVDFIEDLMAYDQEMIERHLSPGGAADLLAIGIYFAFLEDIFN